MSQTLGSGLIALPGSGRGSLCVQGKQMAQKNTATQAPSKISLALVINGTEKQLTVAPWTTLLDALREHLRRLELRAREERDRAGYSRQPLTRDERMDWEAEAAWPQE